MNIGLQIIIDINNLKTRLIARAKKKGIYENFGQEKVRHLQDKYSDCEYQGRLKERDIWNLISQFNEWCMNFNDSDLRGL